MEIIKKEVYKCLKLLIIGVYAKVLFVLGLNDNLSNIADIRNDKVGIMIESSSLPKTARAIKNKEANND